ncbi:hypothetical protein ACFWMJ_26680 [Streptomyces hawaiiensis]|uniref:hypothetical protein n=1 Tax=Streptomyces hawaiiensis TaxID=67305 RepID=UPI00365CE3BB
MYVRARIAAATASIVIAAGCLVATAGPAAAAEQGARSCYGNANSYTKASGQHLYPNYPTLNYLVATTDCADINIKSDTDRYVKVCFHPKSGGTQCQADYKLAKAGSWTVIATDVKDKTHYQFYFRSDAKSTGQYAS